MLIRMDGLSVNVIPMSLLSEMSGRYINGGSEIVVKFRFVVLSAGLCVFCALVLNSAVVFSLVSGSTVVSSLVSWSSVVSSLVSWSSVTISVLVM